MPSQHRAPHFRASSANSLAVRQTKYNVLSLMCLSILYSTSRHKSFDSNLPDVRLKSSISSVRYSAVSLARAVFCWRLVSSLNPCSLTEELCSSVALLSAANSASLNGTSSKPKQPRFGSQIGHWCSHNRIIKSCGTRVETIRLKW